MEIQNYRNHYSINKCNMVSVVSFFHRKIETEEEREELDRKENEARNIDEALDIAESRYYLNFVIPV